jgi:hypothetical protein
LGSVDIFKQGVDMKNKGIMKSTRIKTSVCFVLVLLLILVSLGISGCGGITQNPTSYVLLTHSIPGEGGTVQISPLYDHDGKYSPGARVTLEARNNQGFDFVRWSGDVQGTMPSIVVTMDRDKNINAEFHRNESSVVIPTIITTLPAPITSKTSNILTSSPPVTAPSPIVSSTPAPTPSYLPGTLRQETGFSIWIVKCKYTALDAPEREAISYMIQFNNESAKPMEVQFDLNGVSGVDNLGKPYIDETVRTDIYYNQQRSYGFSIPSQSSKVFTFALGRKDWKNSSNSSQNPSWVWTRVDLQTNYVDMTFDKIIYRTDAFHQLDDVTWRLPRP